MKATQEQLRAELNRIYRYDAETGQFFWKVNRGRARAGQIAGSIRKDGYRDLRVLGKKQLAHRMGWLITRNELPNELDHIDRDRSNNVIGNLRIASKSVNALNRAARVNKTGFANVSERKGRFLASIKRDGRRKHLGVFASAQEAAAAYTAASLATH